jgi:NAD+ kinase
MAIRTVGVAIKPGVPRAAAAARDLAKWLAQRGLAALFDPDAAAAVGELGSTRSALALRADLIVVLGGDGTLLAVARAVEERPVPILGINLGTLGFLAEVPVDEMEPALERAVAGELRVEERMRLDVELERRGRALTSYRALNDAVVTNRGALARIIDLETSADGQPVTTYHADGLIVSTPTGSTAYSLSAGGPIVVPTMDAFVITAISPHTLAVRPLVVPATATVSIRVLDPVPDPDELLVSIDGQATAHIRARQDVTIVRAHQHVILAHIGDETFFSRLSRKLAWGDLGGRKS